MKILHITTTRLGSTGKTAVDLKKLLLCKGFEYKIAYSMPDKFPLNGDILFSNRLSNIIHAFLSRLIGLQGYFSVFTTLCLLRRIRRYRPELVQIGNLHSNNINLPLLFRYLSKEKVPVVIVLHDCWFFTGKCTHFTANKCDKWKTKCHQCQFIKQDNPSWFFDFSSKMFLDRLRWYRQLKSLTVIAVSDWEKKLAEQSPLFKMARIERVYNWIDTDIFSPATTKQVVKVINKYNLSSDRKYIISVAAQWIPKSSKTNDAITLATRLPNNYRLIIVGSADDVIFPDSVVRIPYISNQLELAALYSMSSAYVHLSVEDTFGKVIAEAMSCESVPIVFNSTACGETVGPYGLVVPPHDINAIISALPLAEEYNRKKLVRIYAVEQYKNPVNINKYWEI